MHFAEFGVNDAVFDGLGADPTSFGKRKFTLLGWVLVN
jgi:hypothetical protein